jgi:hypothetical protein
LDGWIAGIGWPATGTATSPQGDDTELEKTLGAYALQGALLFSLDNILRALGGGPLDRVLTAVDTVQLRVLGKSEVPTLPWQAVACGTGNNVSFTGDTVRRVLVSRLESMEDRPEDRAGFKYDDLIAHVRENRPRLVVALLTILRAFVAAGSPDTGCKRWGSFESWAGLIPAAIVWAGGVDPMKARPAGDATANPEVAAIVTIIERLRRRAPAAGKNVSISSSELITWLFPRVGEEQPNMGDADVVALREAIAQLCGRMPDPRTLGTKLGTFKGRVFVLEDGSRARLVSHDRHGVARWTGEGIE